MWTYDDWDQQTSDADKLARLLLHIQEVRAKIGPSVGAHGYNVDRATVLEYYKTLIAERKALEATVSGGGIAVARFVRVR